MDAGKLDRKVIFQYATHTRSGTGESIPTWHTFATLWAQVIHLRGRELFAAKQVVPLAEIKVIIRYRMDLNESMRVVHGGITYGIEHIAEIGRQGGLELLCSRPA